MNLLIVLGALIFLMFVAYRGYSVILFAPIAALGAVLLTDPTLVPPVFSSVFMEKTVGFVKNYFPVFMLGAVFGKVIELSGFSKSIVAARSRPKCSGRAIFQSGLSPARSRSARSASRWMPCLERRKSRTSFPRPSSIRRRGPPLDADINALVAHFWIV